MTELQTRELLQRRYAVIGKNSPLFYEQPLHLVRGEGVWVYDADGRKYLDVYNNVPCVGHCHPHVVESIARQLGTLNLHTRYLHENIVEYAERLTAKFDDSLSMAMLACTGSEANEIALRMARQHTGQQGIIVTDFAYHGNTEAVAELGTSFMPEAQTTRRVKSFPIPDSYVGLDGVAAESLADTYAEHVKAAIDAFQAEGIGLAGMLICPDFANEGLLNVPPGFIEKAMTHVRNAGGLYIADEVQGGFGRTGHQWWSHEAEGVTPDIVTLGKPMGNGHPISGVVARADLIEQFGEWGMYFNTFGGNPVSCAAGMAVLDVLEQEKLLDNAVKVGAYVASGLRNLQEQHEVFGDVRDKGLFFAVELVSDRQSKAPATDIATDLINRMCRKGVLISRIGRHDNVLKMRPPMPFSEQNADLLLGTLGECLHEMEV
ncbi:MAG: aspartate aminotransferase family protein [Pseudomonadales bacterium]